MSIVDFIDTSKISASSLRRRGRTQWTATGKPKGRVMRANCAECIQIINGLVCLKK